MKYIPYVIGALVVWYMYKQYMSEKNADPTNGPAVPGIANKPVASIAFQSRTIRNML